MEDGTMHITVGSSGFVLDSADNTFSFISSNSLLQDYK